MKKSFIMASAVAVLALLATSCQPKVDAPTARFSYEADGLEVEFTNLSKDAESYAWDFGDGTAVSTEENPVHEYARFGEYTVKLTAKNKGGEKSYSDVVVLEKKAIMIDGDFSDWEAADAKVAKCSADDNALEDYFYQAKFARDKEFIYFYLEFDAAKDDWDTEEGIVNDYAVRNMSLWLNVDDATGCDIWWWAEGAHIDYLIEGSWVDKFESAALTQTPEELNGGTNDEWLWDDTGVVGAVSSCDAKTLQNGHLAIEGKIMIALLPKQPNGVVKMAIGSLAPDWETYTGRLPQATLTPEGTTELGALIEVPVVEIN